MYSSTYLVPSVSLAAFRKQQSHLTTRESEDFVNFPKVVYFRQVDSHPWPLFPLLRCKPPIIQSNLAICNR